MDLNLTGKKALVGGASSGLGFSAAMALAEEGCELVIVSRDSANINSAAEKIKASYGVSVLPLSADLATSAGLKTVKEAVDSVDILISNTGGPPPGQFLAHDQDKWDEAFKLVMNSARSLTEIVLPGMIKKKWGRLIYITSIGALQPIDDLILSNAYRSAVTAMAKTISNNYAKFGVTSNCVCPGYTATDRLNSLAEKRAEAENKTTAEILNSFTANIPAGRIGKPEELAALITFLASDKAAYITGCSIPVDGGFVKGLI